jgi:hypothetical protein
MTKGVSKHTTRQSLRTSSRELGDSLGTLADGVLGKLTRKQETNSGLNLAGGQGVLLVVASKARSLSSNALKDIVDEGIHDRHGTRADTSVGVNLLQHLVDVGRVRLNSSLFAALLLIGGLCNLWLCLLLGNLWLGSSLLSLRLFSLLNLLSFLAFGLFGLLFPGGLVDGLLWLLFGDFWKTAFKPRGRNPIRLEIGFIKSKTQSNAFWILFQTFYYPDKISQTTKLPHNHQINV